MSNRSLAVKSIWARAPLYNGIGRYIGQLQRITLKFCKSHGASRGMRDFVENNLVDFAKENPGVAVYVKPRRHRHPVIVAEYLDGGRHWLCVKDFDKEFIGKWVDLMRTQSNNAAERRVRRMERTVNPSIQGPWTPFTFRDPSMNLVKFPDDKVGAAKRGETATEKLERHFRDCKILENYKLNAEKASQ